MSAPLWWIQQEQTLRIQMHNAAVVAEAQRRAAELRKAAADEIRRTGVTCQVAMATHSAHSVCGVIAVGRCSTCGLAFCQSHQSVLVNRCHACQEKASEEAAEAARIERQRQLELAEAATLAAQRQKKAREEAEAAERRRLEERLRSRRGPSVTLSMAGAVLASVPLLGLVVSINTVGMSTVRGVPVADGRGESAIAIFVACLLALVRGEVLLARARRSYFGHLLSGGIWIAAGGIGALATMAVFGDVISAGWE